MMWRNTRTSYGLVSRCLHWAIAVLFIGQIPLGLMTQWTAEQPELQFDLYQWHKSTGFLVLALATIRILWSLTSLKPVNTSASHRFEAMAARAVHTALLVFTLAVPLAGWAIASSSPLNIPSYVFNLVLVPNLPIEISDAAEAFWSTTHAWLAYGAAAVVAIHASAAIFHAVRRASRP
ncbi:cytochrome b [Rhizobium sp. SG2393]|uniref:cytochrome b n=1 Tax=Rhizobium sp. SG2393 TaxID=3276279 RepID=UPI003672D36E